jgi:membrane protein involved in colicin uptake
MPRFTDKDISESRATAANARKAMLARFRARPAEDDPAVVERKAARLALSQARKARIAAREADRRAEAERQAAELKLREEEAARMALEQAERDKIERRAEGDRALQLLAEQKAARDSRYAARKARGR